MADDTNLQVGVVVDVSQVDPATEKVSTAVNKMADETNAAFAGVANAPEEAAESISAFGAVAETVTATVAGLSLVMGGLGLGALALAGIIENAYERFQEFEEKGLTVAEAHRQVQETLAREDDELLTLSERLAAVTGGPMAEYAKELEDIGLRSVDLTGLTKEINKELDEEDSAWRDAKDAVLDFAQAYASVGNLTGAAAITKATGTNRREIEEFIRTIDTNIHTVNDLQNAYDQLENKISEVNAIKSGRSATGGDTKDQDDALTALAEKAAQVYGQIVIASQKATLVQTEEARKWQDILDDTLQQGSEFGEQLARKDLEAITKKINAEEEAERVHQRLVDEGAQIDEDEQNRQVAAAQKRFEEYSREQDDELRTAIDVAKRKAQTEAENQGGRGTGFSQLAARKAIIEEEYDAEAAAVQKRISELDPRQVVEAQHLQDQLVRIAEQKKDRLAAVDEEEREDLKRSYEQIVSGPLNGFVNGVISGQERIGVAFQRLGAQLVTNFAETFAKMGLQVVEFWALNEIETALGLQTVGALQARSGIKTVLNNAYVAASAAYADVPFPVNLVAAPAVFALVAALGGGISSAAGGMVVPSDMMAMVHENEVVLPASISKKFLDAAPGGVGGNTANIHFHGNGSSAIGRGQMDQVKKELTKHLRNVGFLKK